MRLLRRNKAGWFSLTTYDFSLTTFDRRNVPEYAILSHRWGADGDEVTFQDLEKGTGKQCCIETYPFQYVSVETETDQFVPGLKRYTVSIYMFQSVSVQTGRVRFAHS
jgi:hypothetical protein